MRAGRLVCLAFVLLASCINNPSASTTFVVASTTSTQDTGLLDELTAEFERSHPGVFAKVIAVGSGEAIELGRNGDADVLMVHSPDLEQEFMQGGGGLFRLPVMTNDFAIAGRPEDPASVAAASTALDAFSRIAATQTLFLSRGDRSGTHARELRVWAGLKLVPSGDWYLESGQGMAETLVVASEKGAYTLTDTATFTVVKSRAGLKILYRGDPDLVNQYSVIPVASAKRRLQAVEFARWLTGPRGQNLIRSFGVVEFGAPLFKPETPQR